MSEDIDEAFRREWEESCAGACGCDVNEEAERIRLEYKRRLRDDVTLVGLKKQLFKSKLNHLEGL